MVRVPPHHEVMCPSVRWVNIFHGYYIIVILNFNLYYINHLILICVHWFQREINDVDIEFIMLISIYRIIHIHIYDTLLTKIILLCILTCYKSCKFFSNYEYEWLCGSRWWHVMLTYIDDFISCSQDKSNVHIINFSINFFLYLSHSIN